MERNHFPPRHPRRLEVLVPLVPVIFLLLALPLLVLMPKSLQLGGIAALLMALRWGYGTSDPASRATALAATLVGLGMVMLPQWLPPIH